MKVRYRLIFARKGLNKDKKGLVQVEAYFDRQRRPLLSTGIYLLESEWNKKVNHVNVTNKETLKKKEAIDNFVSRIETYEYELLRKGEQLTPELIEAYLQGRVAESGSFVEFFEREMEEDRAIRYNTRRTHNNTLEKLRDFRPNLTFSDVNYEFVQAFDNYLRKIGLGINTIEAHHKRLKRYINLAIKKGYIHKYPYSSFRVKSARTERVSMSAEEILLLEQFDASASSKLQKVKDMFLFMCYTGLRYSDMQNLNEKHLQKTKEGFKIKLGEMVKVRHNVYLPLFKLFEGKPQEILERYIGNDFFIFPRYSNQKFNETLKILQTNAEIKTKLTCHVGRHTFGSLMAERTNDPYLIMSLMGHQDIKTSMIYIHMNQKTVDDKLENITW